jgi:hypothetical protein
MKLSSAFISLVLCASGGNAAAVSLSGRTTDDSVCDLSPMTNYHLTRTVFVAAGSTNVPTIYARLALRFVTKECKNSQILILHSEDGQPDDDRAFRTVTTELCGSANVQREPTPTSEYPYSFQVKCRLTKVQEATTKMAALEREKPLDQLISESAPLRSSVDPGADLPKRECGKLTFGQVLLGMGGRCTN